MSARIAPTTRADWIAAGLELLRRGGGDALTLERLCVALGRTKGPFYHHFGDTAAYHHAEVDGRRWRARCARSMSQPFDVAAQKRTPRR